MGPDGCGVHKGNIFMPGPLIPPIGKGNIMKVLGIQASPRGKESRTLRLVNAVLEGARSEGAQTDIVDIYELEIGYCTACGACYASGECTLADDFPLLFDMMLDADGLVLGSPNYIDSITAPLKAVFDRMADAIHCQMLSGKFGCSVCTAGGSRQDEVVGYMNHVLRSLGAITVGGVGVAIGRDPTALIPAEEEAFRLGKRLAQSIRGEHSYSDQEKLLQERRDYFCTLIKYRHEEWAHEYEWYVRMGWIKD
jgi:multimeric flavodoxin WrbA